MVRMGEWYDGGIEVGTRVSEMILAHGLTLMIPCPSRMVRELEPGLLTVRSILTTEAKHWEMKRSKGDKAQR